MYRLYIHSDITVVQEHSEHLNKEFPKKGKSVLLNQEQFLGGISSDE